MSENICFIPARAGSTRLKKKNVAKFKNGTLVSHTIEQAKECGIFQRIILSSDDIDLLLEMNKEYDVEMHWRPDRLATNTTTLIEVLRESISVLEIADEHTVGLLLVTCPLRKVEDIIGAYKLFEKTGRKNTVVSVKKNENPVQMAWKNVGGYLIPVMSEEYSKSTQKQYHFDTFYYNDAIIFDSAKNFMMASRNLFGKKPIPYIMPWERSIAIDYEFQLKIAQCLGEMEEKDG